MIIKFQLINDKFTYAKEDLERIAEFKRSMNESEYGVMTLVKWGTGRSLMQNARLHALFQRIIDQHGIPMSQIKNMFCIEYGIALTWEEFLLDPPVWTFRVVEHEGRKWVRKSTTAYSMREFNNLMKNVELYCNENDIDISDIMQDKLL